MYNIVVCDDERTALDMLTEKLRNILPGCRVDSFDSAFAAESFLMDESRGRTDLLLMDIRLPGGNDGISLCRRVKAAYPQIKIIFFTGYIEYAADIFSAEPVWFLVKPIDEGKLKDALSAAVAAIEEDKANCLTLSARGEVVRIRYSRILYLESVGRTVCIHETGCAPREAYKKLSELESVLPASFLRCHQSFIVNMDRVQRLGTEGFQLSDGTEVPISHQRYRETKERFLKYIGDTV